MNQSNEYNSTRSQIQALLKQTKRSNPDQRQTEQKRNTVRRRKAREIPEVRIFEQQKDSENRKLKS